MFFFGVKMNKVGRCSTSEKKWQWAHANSFQNMIYIPHVDHPNPRGGERLGLVLRDILEVRLVSR
jgi:hypothetical protein